MNDKELQDWQELILHDELNNLDTMVDDWFGDGGGKHHLSVSQRNFLSRLLSFPTPYLKERPHLLDLIGEVLGKDWYNRKERVLLNTIRKNWNNVIIKVSK